MVADKLLLDWNTGFSVARPAASLYPYIHGTINPARLACSNGIQLAQSSIYILQSLIYNPTNHLQTISCVECTVEGLL